MLQWQLQDAKSKLSELIRFAQESPQVITVRGREEAVLISKKYYDKLIPDKINNSMFYGTLCLFL